jgi:Cu-Zn family superoxide dismutase
MYQVFATLTALFLFVTSCGSRQTEPGTESSAADTLVVGLIATLSPTDGSPVSGTVRFEADADGAVIVRAEVSGLESGSRHAMHIHEFGDCSAPDGSSAGGHYNPSASPHGAPGSPADERHAGDLGNLVELAEGVAEFEAVDRVIRLSGDNTIEGRSVIVHVTEDDFTTQPTGNAGKRLACGVILRDEG